MHYLMLYENYTKMNNPTNYKQENAILALAKDYDYTYDEDGDTEYTRKIHQFLLDNGFNYRVGDSRSFYFDKPIPSNTIRGYKNTKITHVDISSIYEVVFHIIFDIENPRIDEITKLKSEVDGYSNLSGDEFELVEDEYSELYSKLKNIDVYISNFTYAYSQSVDSDIIKTVYNEMIKPSNLEKSNHISELTKKHWLMQVKKDKSYQERLEYWELMDELNDLRDYKTPDDAEMELRRKRSLKTEEDYNKEQQYMINLIKNL